MTMTYQQQFVLDGLAGRAAILDLDARHNRLYSAGDLGRLDRHVPSRGGVVHACGGDVHRSRRRVRRRQRSATGHRRPRDQPSTVWRRPNNVSRCCSATTNYRPPAPVATGSSTSAAAGTSRRANSSGTSSHARGYAAGVSTGISYEFAFGTYEDALRMVGMRSRAEIRGHRGERCPHPAFRVDGARRQPGLLGCGVREAGLGWVWSRRRRC